MVGDSPHEASGAFSLALQGNPECILTHSNWATLTAQPSSTNSTWDVFKSLVLNMYKIYHSLLMFIG